jgi:hypothetical protein
MSRKRRKVNCREFEKNVIALLEKTLPQGTGESLEEHRSECEGCASLAATMEQILQEAVPPQDVALSQQFWPALVRRIREHDSRGLAFGKLSLRPIALTACLLLAVWAGVHLGNAYVNQELVSPGEEYSYSEEIEEIVPFFMVLDDVPHGSLAELLLREPLQNESKR